MTFWLLLTVNSVTFGGLLFLLSAGFSLIFGLMRIPNLMHGSFFMLGAYFGVSLLNREVNFWVAALTSGAAIICPLSLCSWGKSWPGAELRSRTGRWGHPALGRLWRWGRRAGRWLAPRR